MTPPLRNVVELCSGCKAVFVGTLSPEIISLDVLGVKTLITPWV